MYRTKSETKLVWWPTPQDYNEAVQIPQTSLQDPELKTGLPYTNALELPRSITGTFASVYRMHCPRKDYALRLFLSNIRDQHERYALISSFVQNDNLPYTVTFDFLTEGIKIHGEWHPALKMEWLEGEQLDDHIVNNLANPAKLGELLEKFVTMMHEMRRAGIAHGDLQHGNILVCNGELRLVDYDGMFVPAMQGFSAGELGHRNYQHPDRAAHHFGPYLDNFSAWIIYASVRALQIDSRLMHQLGGGDDCLLFRQVDFLDPLHSPAFAALEQHPDERLKELGRFVRAQLKNDLSNVPYLELPIKKVQDLELHPVSEAAPVVKSGARLVRGNIPDWLQDDNATVLSNAKIGHFEVAGSASKSNATANSNLNNMPPNPVLQSWTVPAKPAQNAAWIKPAAVVNASSRVDSASALQNQITNSIQAAAVKKLRQQAGAAFQKPTFFPVNPQLPAQMPVELQVSTGPRRKVRWNPLCGRLNPRGPILAIMVLNPLVWMMLSFGSQAVNEGEVAAYGVTVPATVYHIDHHFGKDGAAKIFYHYKLNGRTYPGEEVRNDGAKGIERDGTYQINVLPRKPLEHETLNAPLGSKGRTDALYFLVLLLINFILMAPMLWAPLRDKKIARVGHALIATIDNLRTETFVRGGAFYRVDISFGWGGERKCQTIELTPLEWARLGGRPDIVVLYDPKSDSAQIYDFCRYHPVIGAIVNKSFP